MKRLKNKVDSDTIKEKGRGNRMISDEEAYWQYLDGIEQGADILDVGGESTVRERLRSALKKRSAAWYLW